jgi:hypothetical protein
MHYLCPRLQSAFLIEFLNQLIRPFLINRVGQNHMYMVHVRLFFGSKITKYTVIYGVQIQFWPTLFIHYTIRDSSS